MKIILMALILGALLCTTVAAQAVPYKDVKILERKDPNSKPTKKDGILNLYAPEKLIIFVIKNQVIRAIRFEDITNMVFQSKNKVLTVHYKSDETGKYVEFEIKSGNRDAIVNNIESQTGVTVQRVKE